MKNVIVRSLSGIVYVAVILCCILLGNRWFFSLTEALIIVGLVEYLRLACVGSDERVSTWLSCFTLVCGVSMATLAYGINEPGSGFTQVSGIVFILSLLGVLFTGVMDSSPSALKKAMRGIFGVVYVALPLSLLNVVYMTTGELSAKILILVSLIAIWVNDTGAFCIGTLLGKHRLCERLSPKKSWEGFWGGLIFVVIGMVIFSAVAGYNVWMFAAYGVLITILATVGDLFESALKRNAGVKDSGNIIPGHGGILDRIDSLLFVSYAVFLMSFLRIWE